MFPEVSETASADVQFGRQNSKPAPGATIAERNSEELFPRVLQGGLYAIDGRNAGANLPLTSAP